MKKKLFINIMEHMDPMWRRCFDRDLPYKNQNFVPYSDIEKYFIEDNIALCKKYPFYKFELECVLVLKKFLEKNPQYEEDVAGLATNGQMHFSFSGNNIVDSNMVQGESLIRNFLNGYSYLKEKYNYISEGVDRLDAFGNSGQLPQIIRGFGSKWVKNIAYAPCRAPYWEGIDGSKVYQLDPPIIGRLRPATKYRPCPVCGGKRDKHCEFCGDRRIDVPAMEATRPPFAFDEAALDELTVPGMVSVGGEEILPSEDTIRWAIDNQDKYDISFITYQDYLPYYQKELEQLDAAENVHPSAELNPCNSGCLVSRIQTKQRLRQLENVLSAVETLAAVNRLQGGEYPADRLNAVWEKAFFTMFHDAVTGTHVDAAYRELMDVFDEADRELNAVKQNVLSLPSVVEGERFTVMNTSGIGVSSIARIQISGEQSVKIVGEDGTPATLVEQKHRNGVTDVRFLVSEISAFGTRVYRVLPDEATNIRSDVHPDAETCCIENAFYRITAGNNGITQVYDKKLDRVVAAAGEYLVGEWILEHDEGSPWTTLSMDMRRTRLAPSTKLIAVEKNADTQTLTYRVIPCNHRTAYTINGVEITWKVQLVRGSDRILFSADVRWDTVNHRLRIAFPCAEAGKHFYEIPYGYIERKPYEPDIILPDGSEKWNGAAGDYPAINWAGIQGKNFSLALFNQGTPSYQINTDSTGAENIYLSVLRSPTVPTFLHEPNSYSMHAYTGMRDEGFHHFEYALKSYGTGFDRNEAVADGIGYNGSVAVVGEKTAATLLPVLTSDDVRIASMKEAEAQSGLICRLVEYHGKDTTAVLKLPDWVKAVYETDMKEELVRELRVTDGVLQLQLRHFEIKTLCLKF